MQSKEPADGSINRREFLDAGGKYAACVLTAARLLEGIPAVGAITQATAQKAAPGLPSTIAKFVVNMRYEALTPKALEWAKTAVLDCLGTALAGSREESGKMVTAMAREDGSKAEQAFTDRASKLRLLRRPSSMVLPRMRPTSTIASS